MYFIITGTSQHFGRLVINVDQNNIRLFHKGGYINIRIEQQNGKAKLGLFVTTILICIFILCAIQYIQHTM